VGFAMTDNGSYFTKTYEGGYTWEYDSLWGVMGGKDFFVVDSTIMVLSGSQIAVGYNYGPPWDTSVIFTGNGYAFNDVFFINKDTGFVVGNSQSPIPPYESFGAMAYTYDGGQTWSPITLNTGYFFWHEIAFYNDTIGYLTGHKNGGGGAFLKTIDGGQNWYHQQSIGVFEAPGGFAKFAIVNEHIAYASGSAGTIFKTTNGGGALLDVGVDEKETPRVMVYPNPADGMLYFSLPTQTAQNIYFELIDISGRTVMRGNATNSNSVIDLSTIPAGMYTLVLIEETRRHTASVIKL
jgi:photosystem II stability/assembly factor-like uncharacterized protein